MTDKSEPGPEPPLFIEALHTRGFHHEYRSNRTAGYRFPITPSEIWNETDPVTDIPDVNPVPEATNIDGATSLRVTLRKELPLTQVANNTATGALVFETTPAMSIMEVIPGSWGADGSYQPVLRDSTGAVVPFNPQVWTIDGVNHTLEFPQNAPLPDGQTRAATGLPTGVTAPFTVTFWMYNGTTGGAGGGGGEVNTGTNLGAGEGVFIGPNMGVLLPFKSLVAGKDVTLTSTATEITIDSNSSTFEVVQAAHGISLGEAVFLDDATGAWALAQANDVNTIGTHLAVEIIDANTFCVSNNGPFPFPAHGLGPVGTYLYVSATVAGGLVSAPPASPNFNNPIAQVLTAGDLLVLPYRASQATAAAGGSLGTTHLTASDVQDITGPATIGSYGFMGTAAAVVHAPATVSAGVWSTATPLGYTGTLPTVRVVFTSGGAGTAQVRLGFQDLGVGASVAASAPTYVGALSAATVAAGNTVASATLTAPAIGALAANRPFALFLERDGTDVGDTLANDWVVHDIFLSY